ncbi:MAG: tetratricopeptide repeat protein [Rubrivivax sp.]|nr:tetratricopeptide repeat protein [Pyrinomonadaceae bacterium]
MTETFLSRFTPSLMSQDALEAIFVGREELARRVVGLIRDSALTEAKHHTLLVGPRGIGKSHFVSLVYHRVRQMEDLRDPLLIAWLREEEWGIASFLDLLLRVLRALQSDYEDGALAGRIEKLYEMPADAAERAAASLLKEYVGDRALLIIVENLDELFPGLGGDGQKRLRAYLQENPFCTILATSQSLFGGVSLQTSPFYGFFRIQHLEDLTLDESTELLTNIANFKNDRELSSFIQTPTGRARIRALRHLAGGNHRVYIIFSRFLTRESLDSLVEPFMRMLDDLTPYYQARMQWLSPQQRKIVEFLCERRGAVTVKEIAGRSFMTHQTASSQLKTLREMGYVQSEAVGRESFYELREPLMRLSIEVKQHRDKPIRLFIDFLRLWHSSSELQQQLAALAADAKLEREYLLHAIQAAESETEDPRVTACQKDFSKYLKAEDYLHGLEVAEELVDVRGSADDWFAYGHCLFTLKRNEEAIEKLAKTIELNPNFADAYCEIGIIFQRLKRFEESLASLNKAVELGDADIEGSRGITLFYLDRFEDALSSFEKMLKSDRKDVLGWDMKGFALIKLRRLDEALTVFDESIKLDPKRDSAWGGRGIVLSHLNNNADAIAAFDRAIELNPNNSDSFFNRINSLVWLDRWSEAFTALDHTLSLFPDKNDNAAMSAGIIVYCLFTKEREAGTWQARARDVIEIHARHNALSALGQGIMQNVSELMSPMVSDAAAGAWRDVWRGVAEGREELQLPVRLLDAAVRYRETKDQRVLLELPAEERALLEEALQGSSSASNE